MPRIPMIAPAQQNVDEIQLQSFAAEVWDGYIDDLEFLVRRPGLVEFVDLSTSNPVDGMFPWDEMGLLMAVAGGELFKITEAGVVTSLGSGLPQGIRPSFVAFKQAGIQYLAVCADSRIYTTDGTAAIAEIPDTEAPTSATQMVHIDGYLLANDNDDAGKFKFSEVGDAWDWKALDFQNAASKPDDINGCYGIGGLFYAFGNRSIEVFYNDGVTPWQRNQSYEVQGGCIAPKSIQQLTNKLVYMDEFKRVVILEGTIPRVISGPIAKKIQALDNVLDAYADTMYVAGQEFYVLTFPTDGIVYVYDIRHDRWYNWGAWNASTQVYDQYIGKSHAFMVTFGTGYVGSLNNDGKVFSLDPETYTDDDAPIRTRLRSGYIDHGTLKNKVCQRLAFRLKRGDLDEGAATTQVSIKHRNEDEGEYGNEQTFDMGNAGDNTFFLQATALGMYRARQWEISCSSDTPFIMGEVIEDIQVGVS